MGVNILEMKGITKEFPGVRALDGVTFSVGKGEIHSLVGENGAGKSTLMKILSGVYPSGSYDGSISIDGRARKFADIKDSERAGVAIIHQELALIQQLSIAENVTLGDETAHNGVINWDECFLKTEKALKQVGLDVSPAMEVSNLGVGEQQLVAIAKALSKQASILILDEPTASLSSGESGRLLNILKSLKEKGVTCIYISHRLKEVFDISDSITVLRDGATVGTYPGKDLDENKLISLMVGRELSNIYPRKERVPGATVLEIRDWTAIHPGMNRAVRNINLTLRKGEVLCIAGLVGAGRTELVMSLFHMWGRPVSGRVYLEGKEISMHDAGDAVAVGISMASEDRKRYGLILDEDIKRNISLASLKKISTLQVVNGNEEIKYAEKYTADLKIKTPSIEQKAGNLSGGNQQKVVLGKWLMTEPKVLILDEPTRGIDVGAKVEIYNIINELVDKGVAVLVISSELNEVLGISDRIIVMQEGHITGELLKKDATQENIMMYATGTQRVCAQ
ncbi:MAG: ATP-binding cassette domain-containing protein [Candidatus Omnitrophota bacterium]|jgi:D-xylose transport system ATP-binding protein